MKPEDDRAWLDAALDDELDVERSQQLQARLARDPKLQAAWERQRALRSAIRKGANYHTAPTALRARIAQMMATHEPAQAPTHSRPRRASILLLNEGRRRWAQAAATALVAAALGAGVTWRLMDHGSSARDDELRIAEDAVAGHIRASMMDRLIDVASSDQHTVKPWLSARLTYSPPVPDLSAHGFDLVGARRDVIDGEAVATLVYRRRQHIISAYVQPTLGNAAIGASGVRSVRGFNVIEAAHGTLRYWIVSDLNARELGDFSQLLSTHG